jgi:inorganic pyrophosphatase
MLSDFSKVPAGVNIPRVVNAIVEIPKGRRSKFELCKKTGLIRLDRYLYSSSHYPGDYGLSRRPSPRTAIRLTSW